MDRPRRQSRVQDYRKFHFSGDIQEGTVAATVRKLESPAKIPLAPSTPSKHSTAQGGESHNHPLSNPLHIDIHHIDNNPPKDTVIMSEREQQLEKQLQEQKDASTKLQQELKELKLQTQIQLESQKHEHWGQAIAQIKEFQQAAKAQSEKQWSTLQTLLSDITHPGADPDLAEKLKALLGGPTEEEKQRKAAAEAERAENKQKVARLMEQQKQLQVQAEEIAKLNLDQDTRASLELLSVNKQPQPQPTSNPLEEPQ